LKTIKEIYQTPKMIGRFFQHKTTKELCVIAQTGPGVLQRIGIVINSEGKLSDANRYSDMHFSYKEYSEQSLAEIMGILQQGNPDEWEVISTVDELIEVLKTKDAL
jgi:hypothetical protein